MIKRCPSCDAWLGYIPVLIETRRGRLLDHRAMLHTDLWTVYLTGGQRYGRTTDSWRELIAFCPECERALDIVWLPGTDRFYPSDTWKMESLL